MESFSLYISNKRYQSKYSKGFLRVELAQIDAQAKSMPQYGRKEAGKAKRITVYLQKTRNGVLY